VRWLLDSNVWIEAIAGKPAASIAVLQAAVIEWAGFSSITRLEILGFPKITASDEAQFLKMLRQFHELPVSSEVIDEAIRIRRGFRIKTPDALIAASALTARAELVTRNSSDFVHIPGLIVLNPDSLAAP
jgi:toxin FitB